jgi:neopullulanase
MPGHDTRENNAMKKSIKETQAWLALLLLTVSNQAWSESIRVEPEFWWAQMHNPQLQLMLHGERLAELSVTVEGDGMRLLGTEQTDNPNYLFITLDLAKAKAQRFHIRLTGTNARSQLLDYELKGRKPGSAERQGFDNRDVIYLITPDRFANGDPGNDSLPNMLETVNRGDPDGRHGGDIQGIREHLPYLAELGVTQLWLNPLLENNQPRYSYHGYSVTDHYRTDPRFGSNQDYLALVQDAKRLGLGIIMDQVVNHIGSNHWWLKDLPANDWLNYAGNCKGADKNSGTEGVADARAVRFTSHRRTTVQDPYAIPSDSCDFTDGWFVDTMADLNQRNPLLATYLIQNSIWWVEYADLAGIREDTYSYADKDFLARWSKAIMDEYPHFNIVGEEWSANPAIVSYWQRGKRNADGYVSHLPSMMDFPLHEQLVAALKAEESHDKGWVGLFEALANDLLYANPQDLVLFEGNHDTNRIHSLLGESLPLTKMALAYVLTSNRIPQLFYGTEILLKSPVDGRNDGAVRADFPGGWQGDKLNAFSGEGLNQDQREMQGFIRTLLEYRKTSRALQRGGLRHSVPEDGVYLQLRCEDANCREPGTRVLTIYNKQAQPTSLMPHRIAALAGHYTQARDIISGQTVSLDGPITLHSPGVQILELQD